jgi:hypothetical protein
LTKCTSTNGKGFALYSPVCVVGWYGEAEAGTIRAVRTLTVCLCDNS